MFYKFYSFFFFFFFLQFQIYESMTLFHKNSVLFSILFYINHQ